MASEFETDDEEGEGEGEGAGEGEGDMDDFLMFEQEDREAEDPTHTFFKTKTVHIRRPRRQPRKGEGGCNVSGVSRTLPCKRIVLKVPLRGSRASDAAPGEVATLIVGDASGGVHLYW